MVLKEGTRQYRWIRSSGVDASIVDSRSKKHVNYPIFHSMNNAVIDDSVV